ncbi:hypothetical protein DPMN_120829 [Dreissena polymorpha]|uniref:Uncharacterized protein n=1 Tax=Dreissena polymorpha TaxID=45954 RepID=A0A9D4JT19_DREPO|nr:hypothetical protein DPMN_120829 [Dreissena polymorpha]
MFFRKPNMSGPCGAPFAHDDGILLQCCVRGQLSSLSQAVYVGETGGTLYQRHLLNLSRIRTQHSDPVAEHFYTEGHSIDDFQIMGLEKQSGSDEYRKTIRQLWEAKLRTYRSYGINVQEINSQERARKQR